MDGGGVGVEVGRFVDVRGGVDPWEVFVFGFGGFCHFGGQAIGLRGAGREVGVATVVGMEDLKFGDASRDSMVAIGRAVEGEGESRGLHPVGRTTNVSVCKDCDHMNFDIWLDLLLLRSLLVLALVGIRVHKVLCPHNNPCVNLSVKLSIKNSIRECSNSHKSSL